MPVLSGAEPFSHDGGDIGVLLSHGFTGSPQSMRPWAEHLAGEGFTVRLPRLPGHGTSWQELNRTRFEDWYAVVDAALTELTERCSKVVVGGLSMGGTLVTRLAEQRGADVAGLMLVNPAFRSEDRRLVALPLIKAPRAVGPGDRQRRPQGGRHRAGLLAHARSRPCTPWSGPGTTWCTTCPRSPSPCC